MSYLPPPDIHWNPQPADPVRSGPSNGIPVTSLVLGIVALCIPVFGFVPGVLAVIFGALRLRKGAPGRGMAIAGFVCGLLAVIAYSLIFILVIIGSSGSSS